MKLTINHLRRIIREEIGRTLAPQTVKVEVDYGEFPGKPMEGDVTDIVMAQQEEYGTSAGIIRAVCTDAAGLGGGNPVIEITFDSMESAETWWEETGYAQSMSIEDAIV